MNWLAILKGAFDFLAGFLGFVKQKSFADAEVTAIESDELRKELSDAKAAEDAVHAVRNDPASVRDDPDNYATHPHQ